MNGCFHHVQDRCSLDPRVVESMDTEHAGPLRVLGKRVLATVRSMCAAPRQPPVIFLSRTHDILTRDKPHSTSYPPCQPNQSPQLSQGTPLEPYFDPFLSSSATNGDLRLALNMAPLTSTAVSLACSLGWTHPNSSFILTWS